jgi:hypothetical protein
VKDSQNHARSSANPKENGIGKSSDDRFANVAGQDRKSSRMVDYPRQKIFDIM